MNGRRLLTLSALALLFACEDHKKPTGPTGLTLRRILQRSSATALTAGIPTSSSSRRWCRCRCTTRTSSSGNSTTRSRPSLKIEICELKSRQRLLTHRACRGRTPCVRGAPLKTFAPGSVQLVNLPRRQFGWWNLFGLPPDGFYYVLWDTRQSNLNVNKYYRIKVLIAGSPMCSSALPMSIRCRTCFSGSTR